MVKELFVSVLAAVLMTLAIMVAKRVLTLLKLYLEKEQKAAEKNNNESLATLYSLAMTVLDTLAGTTVSRIEATQAATVRKAVKAGEKPFTELTKLSDEAYQDVVAQLSPKIMEALEACVGDTEKLIRNKIEEVLPEIKQKYAAISEQQSLIADIPDMGFENGETTES